LIDGSTWLFGLCYFLSSYCNLNKKFPNTKLVFDFVKKKCYLWKIKNQGTGIKDSVKWQPLKQKIGVNTFFGLRFWPNSFFVLLIWKLYDLVQDFILFTFQSLNLEEQRESCLIYSERGRVIEWPHFINGFYSTRKIQLRSFKTLILFEKINWGWENIPNFRGFLVW
jgi:hypothetical protein